MFAKPCVFIRFQKIIFHLSLQKTIFEPFVSSKDNGTGLGLMIVKRIVENHQGMIFIQESSADGTIFVLDLPLNK